MAQLLDELERQGIREETIVLFTSDHGCHFGSRNAENKRSCHDASIRVPFVVDGPRFRGGNRLDDLVSLVDLVPTVLHGAGVGVPDAMEGRLIGPLVAEDSNQGIATNGDWHDDVFVQINESAIDRAIRTDRYAYAVYAPEIDGHETSAADRYVERYLYDLRSVLHQRVNRLGQAPRRGPVYRAVADRLRERLRDRIEAIEGDQSTVVPASHPA